MQGGALWLLIVAPAAAVGAYLFINTNNTNVTHQKAVETRIERDKAEFDRDFAKTFNRDAVPAQEKRVAAANQAVEKEERLDAQQEAKAREQAQALAKQLGEAFGAKNMNEREKK